MRKMKKINGYLVVRFNDREKREDDTLGSFGVIDAEEYTGDLEMDRGVMEYDDADSLEVAVEQARSLNAEEDYTGLPATCTVIRETDRDTEMNQVDPQLMIAGWTAELEQQVKNQHYDNILVKSSTTSATNVGVTVSVAAGTNTDGLSDRVTATIQSVMKISKDRNLNELLQSDLIYAIRRDLSSVVNVKVTAPADDLILGTDIVIVPGTITVTIQEV